MPGIVGVRPGRAAAVLKAGVRLAAKTTRNKRKTPGQMIVIDRRVATRHETDVAVALIKVTATRNEFIVFYKGAVVGASWSSRALTGAQAVT